jgi:hypothetical protein
MFSRFGYFALEYDESLKNMLNNEVYLREDEGVIYLTCDWRKFVGAATKKKFSLQTFPEDMKGAIEQFVAGLKSDREKAEKEWKKAEEDREIIKKELKKLNKILQPVLLTSFIDQYVARYCSFDVQTVFHADNAQDPCIQTELDLSAKQISALHSKIRLVRHHLVHDEAVDLDIVKEIIDNRPDGECKSALEHMLQRYRNDGEGGQKSNPNRHRNKKPRCK